MTRSRLVLTALAAAAMAGCGEQQSLTAPMMAQGGGKSGSFASLAGGLETATRQPVGAIVDNEDGSWRLQGTDPFYASIALTATHAFGTGPCVAGAYGFEGDEDVKAELLQLLLGPLQNRNTFQAFSGGPIVVVWDEADGRHLLVQIRQPTVSQSDNLYTYAGGTVSIHRSNGLKGKAQIKHDMTCPNLDTIYLTFPAP